MGKKTNEEYEQISVLKQKAKAKRIIEVDCIATGYEWICPACEHLNTIVAYKEDQECPGCGQLVLLNPPEHVYDN